MKKSLTYGLCLIAAAFAGAACRVWQRQAAFEDSGLLTPGHPATWCLVALLVLAAVGFFALSRRTVPKKGPEDGPKDKGPGSYLQAFSLPDGALMGVYMLAGALLVAAGALDLWQKSQGQDPEILGISQTILAVALIPTGVAMGLVGRLGTERQETKGRFAWPLLLPAYCGCVWLIALYQTYATDPNTFRYAVSLFGGGCAALCCYTMAAFSFEKPMGRATLWLGAMAVTGLASYFADCCLDDLRSQGLVCAGYMLYVAAQVMCLAHRCQKPAKLKPWTPENAQAGPANGEKSLEIDDVETEVTDHE